MGFFGNFISSKVAQATDVTKQAAQAAGITDKVTEATDKTLSTEADSVKEKPVMEESVSDEKVTKHDALASHAEQKSGQGCPETKEAVGTVTLCEKEDASEPKGTPSSSQVEKAEAESKNESEQEKEQPRRGFFSNFMSATKASLTRAATVVKEGSAKTTTDLAPEGDVAKEEGNKEVESFNWI
ncbi:biorientation of chromosomes in cell division protein 1-like 1 isoform X2 [Penaeus monodon]|nr:biorientation of chromosomes in cell division protein 1-like 1 isoform X2 [Penaeus monodon]